MSAWDTYKHTNPAYWPVISTGKFGFKYQVIDDLIDALTGWVDNVNANNKSLSNLGFLNVLAAGPTTVLQASGATGRVGIGTSAPSCVLDVHCAAAGQSLNLTDGVNSTLLVTHGSTPTANSVIFNALGSGSIHFENNGVQTFSLLSGNGIQMKNLRSTNPGTGSKQLWYDPADSNRIKYAP
jgi:hypothetical protein